MKNLFLLVIFFVSVWGSEAQTGQLNLINGKVKPISSYYVENNEFIENTGSVFYVDLAGKRKSISIEDIYSISLPGYKDSIFYAPDYEYGEILSVEQMGSYIKGLQYSNAQYHSSTPFIGGVVAGFIGGIIPPLELKLEGNQAGTTNIGIGLAVPIGYVLIIGNSSVSSNKIATKYNVDMENEYLIEGFKEGTRKKRLKQSALGAILGYAVGFGTYIFIAK